MRPEVLAHFQSHQKISRGYGLLVQFHDPELQPLLEEVWAPMWDELNASDEDIERDVYGYPGVKSRSSGAWSPRRGGGDSLDGRMSRRLRCRGIPLCHAAKRRAL
jgi:hypothetical protein